MRRYYYKLKFELSTKKMNVINENQEIAFKIQKINRNIWEKLGLNNKKHYMIYGHNDEKLYYSIQKSHMLAFWDIYNGKSGEFLLEFTNISEQKMKPKMGFMYRGSIVKIEKKFGWRSMFKVYQNDELIGQLSGSSSPLSRKRYFEISEKTNIDAALLFLVLHLHRLNNS